MKFINSTSTHFCKLTLCCLIILIGLNLPGYAQQNKMQPSWWFGLAGGANFNFYHGSVSSLNQDVSATPPFDKGDGVGGNIMALIEFHKPGSFWGIMLLQGLDSRRASFDQSGKEFKAKIGYFTVEPSLVITPPRSNIYFYAGPRLGLLWSSTFEYKQNNSPDYPNESDPEAHAYIRSLRKNPVSMQVGVGYNFRLTPRDAANQFAISPFVTYLPSLGRNLRTIESLKLNTIRAGIILKAGPYLRP